MFEIGILCVIGLAVGYWATLWLMGRRDDVLHGDFVHTERRLDPAPAPLQNMPVPHMPVPAAPRPPDGSDSLQTLLAAIKRDLKDAAQI